MARVLLICALAFAATACGGKQESAIEVPPTTTAKRFAGGELSPPRPAPPLSLRDADGRRVTLAGLRGRYALVTFLYVNCPDVCPLIAPNLNSTLRQLGDRRDDVRVLAVSVDPKGDTPAAVRRFARERGLVPEFRYLIGSRAELRKTWAAWHVLAVQQNPELVDHVAYTALVDPAGKQRVLYSSDVKAAQVLHDLRLLMRSRA